MAGAARRVALVLAALTLGSVSASAAPWLQYGFDAARTGATPDPGPGADDVAFAVEVPGVRVGTPVVFDGAAWVLVQPDVALPASTRAPPPNLTERGVVRVDLASGAVSQVVALDRTPRAWASDGSRFFVVRDGGVEAFGATGEALWSWEHPDPAPQGVASLRTLCSDASVAVREGVVFVSCWTARPPGVVFPAGVLPPFGPQPKWVLFAAALDAASGEPAWVWTKALQEETEANARITPAEGPPANPTTGAGLAVVADRVFVVSSEFVAAPFTATGFDAFALDAVSGEMLWVRPYQSAPTTTANPETAATVDAERLLDTAASAVPAVPTGNGEVLYLKFADLVAVDPATGQTRYSTPMPTETALFQGANGLVAVGDRVYVASLDVLYGFDTVEQVSRWSFALPPQERWGLGMAHANGTVYVRTVQSVQGTAAANSAVYAFEAGSGDVRWRHAVPPRYNQNRTLSFAVGEGVLVVAGGDGIVTVLGRTAASLRPVVDVPTLYPAPGETVRVDLSRTAAGVSGPASEFRADWGDGSVTDWSASPAFEHAYTTRGEQTATFRVRNAAGQSATEVVVFRVGEPEPTFLQEAFSADRQETTFFVLGVAGTSVGGVIGLLRLQRRRHALEREMKRIEDAYAQTSARPSECERMLQERRAHVRGLVLDGKLDESQGATLERRIEEMTRTLRLHELEELMDLLPRGMARALDELLADGRVTTWERRSFLEVLEHDRVMPPEMKARVRAVIDAWYARDSGRA